MNAEERGELTRDVSHIIAGALSPTTDAIAQCFEQIVALEKSQTKLSNTSSSVRIGWRKRSG